MRLEPWMSRTQFAYSHHVIVNRKRMDLMGLETQHENIKINSLPLDLIFDILAFPVHFQENGLLDFLFSFHVLHPT